ncbi:siderophore-interacting protein [Nocardioides sp. B-3]|uniref:siderophore-interacting protein n=1 Tax=Nocardioides sp. B-3 TaxID=2895565 RepID=UPI00215361AB|nr:siderophore-interacting protein [Nocardioides sp. B-3]UUZ61359.1 siderophore-interacting protein [Nocardioides sp. B-3]
MTTSIDVLPMLLTEVEVVSAERLSPTFVRLSLGGAELADFGVDGPRHDQRIKLIFPDPVTGGITSVENPDESRMATRLDQPTEERGHMRTYTIRDVRGSGADTTIVVDIVLHSDGDEVGPGSNWAASATTGDRIVMLAPRAGFPYGGIEFTAPAGADLLMVADETAVPAVCTVLEQLPPTATGAVFMEVPTAADFRDVRGPSGVTVTWLARGDSPPGQRLHDEVVAHPGTPGAIVEVAPDEVDPDLWETPSYSSSGEEIARARAVGHEFDGLYARIAGESKVVTGLRRHLVNELHIDRSRVAFMGYWRRGVAMKS